MKRCSRHSAAGGAVRAARVLAVAAVVLASISAGIPGAEASAHHEVTSLPGWDGALPSRWFSGFEESGPAPGEGAERALMHYIFIESERDPAADPVLVWYNGGPGASSLFGLMVELGPLILNEDSLPQPRDQRARAPPLPRLLYNHFSWTRGANLLVVNSPPPVGFSYCEPAGPAGDGNSCGPWDDALVAKANHAFLTALFNGALRAYLGRQTFLSGESYAGVYVPTIAREILDDPRGINLAGMAVGDGCMGAGVLCGIGAEPYYQLEFFHGHGQVSERLARRVRAACPDEELRSRSQSPACRSALDDMGAAVGGYYSYGLYDECYWNPGNPFADLPARNRWGPAARAGGFDPLAPTNGYPCPGTAFSAWLAHPEVRKALGVDPGSYFFSADNAAGFDYTLSERDVRPIHLRAVRDPRLRTLVYNGDTDPGINSFVTQDKFALYWEEQGLPIVDDWRPWTLDGAARVAGYSMEYEGNWTFATVRGSGHMVPEYKPAAALELISAFLEGRPLKPYSPRARGDKTAPAQSSRATA